MFPRDYAQLPIFKGLSEIELNLLDSVMELQSYGTNQIIFEQGSKVAFLYILLKGEVTIHFKPYDGPSIVVSTIQPGGVFGWSAIVGREEYTSKANTVIPSLTYRINAQNVRLLCNQYPETGEKFINLLISGMTDRINHSDNHVKDSLRQGMKMIDMYGGSKENNG
jgi:CRP/FNR family transcriptional regulator, nitrogen oxide reductase regulator